MELEYKADMTVAEVAQFLLRQLGDIDVIDAY